MVANRLKLVGPAARGLTVNAALLRDVLELTIEGARRALRLRSQGRSTGPGRLPRLIAAATDFDVRIEEGSTILEIDAPTLAEADPEYFAQTNLFPEIASDRTSFDYLALTFDEALQGSADATLDEPMLELLARFGEVFDRGVNSLEFQVSQSGGKTGQLTVRESDLRALEQLRQQIPPPQAVRIAGKLDQIRHSDGTFSIELPTGDRVKGLAGQQLREPLQALWGQPALVLGTAHFAASGRTIRIEAQDVRPASEGELSLWAFPPEPQRIPMPVHEIRSAQGPRTGMNAIVGLWPGDEDDDLIGELLEKMS